MTNEEYLIAIDKRCSRRTFRNIPLDEDTKAVIRDMVEYVNQREELQFYFVEDARFAFNVQKGNMSLIAVCGRDTVPARELCGYYGETIVLQCAFHGLGTCWVGTYNENKLMEVLDIPKGYRLYCVIAIGFVSSEKSVKEKIIYNATHKKSKPYQKMFEFCDEKLPPEYVFAMQQVEKAPSSVNCRPVNFRYENGVISGSVEEPYSIKSIDFGIAQLHFQLGASAKGIKGEWKDGKFIADGERIIKFPTASETE